MESIILENKKNLQCIPDFRFRIYREMEEE